MRIVVFLVCMCCLLLSGGRFVKIPSCQSIVYETPGKHIETNQQLKSKTSNHPFVNSNVNIVNGEEEFLIGEEDEDEIVNRQVARKCITLYNGTMASGIILGLSNHQNFCNASRPYYRLSSNKYISQRVLRI